MSFSKSSPKRIKNINEARPCLRWAGRCQMNAKIQGKVKKTKVEDKDKVEKKLNLSLNLNLHEVLGDFVE